MRCRTVLVAAALLTLTACDAMIPRFEPIRYRLEAQVETPVGVKTGSSVIEVTTDKSLRSICSAIWTNLPSARRTGGG